MSDMEPLNITTAELAAAEPRSVVGLVKIEGWLVLPNGAERGWLAASEDTVPEPVVHVDQASQIHEGLLKSRVSPFGGGPYTFVNRASLTGSLELVSDGYLLSDVDEIAVCEMVHLWLNPSPNMLKKKSDS